MFGGLTQVLADFGCRHLTNTSKGSAAWHAAAADTGRVKTSSLLPPLALSAAAKHFYGVGAKCSVRLV